MDSHSDRLPKFTRQSVGSIKTSEKGPDFSSFKQKKRFSYHIPERSQKKSNSKCWYAANLKLSTPQTFLQKLRQRQKEEEKKARKQREEKQRLRKQRRLRLEEQSEHQQNLQMKVRRYMWDLKERLSPQNTFSWYFSKNNTFKAFEVPKEKLKELDQCVICFSSFCHSQDPTHSEFKPEIKPLSNEEQKMVRKKYEMKSNPNSKQYLARELTQLYCNHTFHKECIKKWLLTNPNCPICRKNFREHEILKQLEKQRQEHRKEEFKRIKILPEQRRLILQSLGVQGMLDQYYENFENE